MKTKIQSIGGLVWHGIKVAWWGIALIVGIIIAVLLVRKSTTTSQDAKSISTHAGTARAKIDEALVGLRIERAVLQAHTTAQRDVIEDIRKDPDGDNRRKRLAEFLQKNL